MNDRKNVKFYKFQIGLSRNRRPKQVVFVIDQELGDLSGFKSLNFIQVRGLQMDNVFEEISKSSFYRQGSLFVVFAGLYYVLTVENNAAEYCNPPLYQIRLHSQNWKNMTKSIINAAKNQHHALLLNSTNDDMVFGPIPTLSLRKPNESYIGFHIRRCNSKDCKLSQIRRNITYEDIIFQKYLSTYNDWVENHCKYMGYDILTPIYRHLNDLFINDEFIHNGDGNLYLNIIRKKIRLTFIQNLINWSNITLSKLKKNKVCEYF